MKQVITSMIMILTLLVIPGWAARKQAPTGSEINEKGRQANLDVDNASTGENCKYTPTRLDAVRSLTDLENGQVIGVLETETVSDKTSLPPGKYNLFLAKVGGRWHVYAESGGNIVAEAYSVTERKNTPKGMKPKFSHGSFCWWVWLIFTGFQVCV